MGNLFDMILVIVFIFVFAVILYTGLHVVSQFRAAREEGGASNATLDRIDNVAGAYSMWNYLFAFLLIGLFFAIGVSAFFIRSHPIFFFISLPVFIFVLILAAIFSNTFETFANTTTMSAYNTTLSTVTSVMNNMPIWVLVGGAVVLILLYAKRGSL